MFIDLLHGLKTIFFVALLITGSAQPMMAGVIVDLYKDHPLGSIIPGKTGEQVYFSLGNGRALAFSVDQEKMNGKDVPQKLLLKKMNKTPTVDVVSRRNIRW